jgi:predicted nucleic acid-binding protein
VGTLIDTSVIVAAERGLLDLEAIRSVPASPGSNEQVAVSAVTAAELLHGVERLRGARRVRAERFVNTLLDRIPVIAFDLPVARVHAMLSADLAERGSAIGAHDLLIAATAMARDYTVATRDLRSFPRIDGLRITRW